MPGRTGSAVMTALAPSAVDPAVADALPALGRPVSGTAVSDTAVSDADAVTDDWPADDWPADEGPADDGPGLVVSWTGGVSIDQVLSAVHRYQRHRAGLDLPAWGEVGHSGKPDDQSAGAPGVGPQDDELGEEAATAAHQGRGRVLSVAALGGHAIMPPGPDLAGWLACSRASERDDAALVTSITAWRKVTSWAQAQELAAVAELARRRRVAGTVDAGGQDCDRAADAGDRDPVADIGRGDHDPVAELEAGFAPNEVALALTLTQGSAEYWMDLAVSLTRRLPATLAALGEGTIDLNRAKLIDQYTSSLDAGLARTVERRVLVRAEHQTTGQLRASLQRAVLAADPAAAERRRQEAQRRAWVALFGDHDGTASLSGRFLPAAQAAAAWARICAMAKAMEAAGAGGGMDLLRAQVFVGLLLGTLPLIPPSDGGPEDAGPGDGGLKNDGGPEDAGPDDGAPGGDGPGGSGPEDVGPDDGAPGGDGPGGSGPEDVGPDDGAPGGDDPGGGGPEDHGPRDGSLGGAERRNGDPADGGSSDGGAADGEPHDRAPRLADRPGEDLPAMASLTSAGRGPCPGLRPPGSREPGRHTRSARPTRKPAPGRACRALRAMADPGRMELRARRAEPDRAGHRGGGA